MRIVIDQSGPASMTLTALLRCAALDMEVVEGNPRTEPWDACLVPVVDTLKMPGVMKPRRWLLITKTI